jgi:Domain of unknown function (DUF4124)
MAVSHMKAATVFPILFLAWFLFPGGGRSAHANYYKYTDKTGAVCFTNNPDSVPKKYRATMKVIRKETLERKDRASRIGTPGRETATPAPGVAEVQKQTAPAPAAPTSTFGQLSARFPWLKAVFITGAILCAFLVVRKLSDLLPSALLGRLILIAFFLGVFVFVYKSYAEHLSKSYSDVKTKILAMFENANKREAPEPESGERLLPAAEKIDPHRD